MFSQAFVILSGGGGGGKYIRGERVDIPEMREGVGIPWIGTQARYPRGVGIPEG